MAIEKIKLTSQTAWETQKKLNDNFSELEGRIDDIEVPTKTSDLTNDSGFIDKTVNDLVNYYTKNDTYSKTEVNTLISGLKTINYEIVSTLPTASATTYFNESKTIYMTPVSSGSGNNYYNEYITTRSGSEGAYTYSWELIGSTQVDLSNYVQKSRTIAGITLENDITASALRTALNVEDGAEQNVQSDWNQTDSTADDYIKNKPTIPTDTGATSIEVTGAGNVVDSASYDSNTRKITLTKGFTAQRAISEISFTVSDSGWSATADANGFYTLTIPSTGKPIIVYNSNGEQVLAGLKSDGTNVYIITDTKFTGSVSIR